MRCVFVHDHKFYKDNKGDIYSPGNLPYSTWKRYLGIFDSLVIIGRIINADNGVIEKMSLSSGQGVEFIPVPDITNINKYFINYIKAKTIIKNVIENIDCLIARLPSNYGIIACKEAEKQGKPWAVEVVGCAWDSLWNHSLKGKIIAPYSFLKNKYWISKSKFAIYVSNEFLQKRYPCKGYIESCSDVEIPSTFDNILENRINRINNMKDNRRPINLGIIGNLQVKYKGHETAFRALASLQNRGIEFRLLCLGGGYKYELENLAERLGIKQSIVFSGTLPSGEPVFNWLDEIDIFLIPSYTEGLPRALIEAMSRGCPAIGSKVGGIPELISKDFIVKPKDWKGLLVKILELANNKELMKEQAIRNFEKAKEYSKEILDKKRDMFWKEFKFYVNNLHK